MDIQINNPQRRRLFKPFELHDLIPYTIASVMSAGFIYILIHFSEMKVL
jgi:hypothetical protein